jgi:threonine synthase
MLTFACAGCGAILSAWEPGTAPFLCAKARPGDDIDHVMGPVNETPCPFPDDGDPNPFVRYRHLLASYALAADAGIGDGPFVQLARELDEAVARVDGQGFRATPFSPSRALAGKLGVETGEVWVKDETGNVGGSHKARHLAGIMLHLLVEARGGRQAGVQRGSPRRGIGSVPEDATATRVGVHGAAGRPPLAIASCGNAALAAGIVAHAAGWPLEVFVPPSASPEVLERLGQLAATVHSCERAGGVSGDPCYLAFREAVSGGAIPFCCQGSDNGLTIDGGKTLAWEMVSSFRSRPARQWGASRLDALFVQVGGGALASALVQGFGDAVRTGALDRPPRFYAVQTTGAYPLKRAYDEVAERILGRVPLVLDQGFSPAADRERAELMTNHPDLIDEEMRYARAHRSLYMRPWEKTPRSVAHGILDDETYDWAVVVEGMLRTGGWPLVVSEERLIDANAIAREATGIDVDHTGSAGLAGLMKAVALDSRLAAERVAVIFSGVRR